MGVVRVEIVGEVLFTDVEGEIDEGVEIVGVAMFTGPTFMILLVDGRYR